MLPWIIGGALAAAGALLWYLLRKKKQDQQPLPHNRNRKTRVMKRRTLKTLQEMLMRERKPQDENVFVYNHETRKLLKE